MCHSCNWVGFLAECDDALTELKELPRQDSTVLKQVRDRLISLKTSVGDRQHVTDKQEEALDLQQRKLATLYE